MYRVVVFCLFAVVLQAATIKMSQEQKDSLGIKIQEAVEISKIALSSYNGQVTQSQKDTLEISFAHDVIVEEIYIEKLSKVKKGEKLLRISSPLLIALQNEYIQAYLEVQNSVKTYERDKLLYENGVIANKRLLTTKREYESLLAKQFSLEKELVVRGLSQKQIAGILESRSVIASQNIYAGQDGYIYGLYVSVGSHVDAGVSLLKMYVNGKQYIDINVPLRVATTLSLEDSCIFEDYKAKIVAISNVVDVDSQTLLVRAEILNPDGVLINGIYEVILLKSVQSAVKVKKSALVFVGEQAYVFKETTSGFEVIAVKIVQEGPVCYVIESTLHSGDKLAASATAALLGAMEEEDE
ncbi:MAG: efflux RND transporter periplasmic adaptor subunit [Campylobacterales bacterium]|nr:efflux RND transporter periplasmic adaptor subunit [Campylobacterales bacterium]